MTIERMTHSEAETIALAKALAVGLQPGDVIALEGPLGAGKTLFVRGLVQGLGLNAAAVSSPTFVICQEYAGRSKTAAIVRLLHIDAYRLSGKDELESIGWPELLETDDAVIAIEWPSRVEGALPVSRIDVDIAHAGGASRSITISIGEEDAPRFVNLKGLSGSAHAAACPMCGHPVARAAETLPFCSMRCRYADLNKWFRGDYAVTRPLQQEPDEG